MKKKAIILFLFLLLLASTLIYGLFRFEWNDYGFGEKHELQKITGALQLDEKIFVTTTNPYLLISNDLGASWELEMFNLDSKEESFTDLALYDNVISFVSRSNYGGNNTPRFLYKSTTKGDIWKQLDIEDLLPEGINVAAESFVIKNNMLQLLDESTNQYYQSDDFGKNWKKAGSSIISQETKNDHLLSFEQKNNEVLLKKQNKDEVLVKLKGEFNLSLLGKVTFEN